MTSSRFNAALIMLLMAFSAASLAGSEGGGGPEGTYDLSWFTIDGGGATFSTGGDPGSEFELGGTIGQPDAGLALTAGSFSLTGGFWPGHSSELVTPCPPDIAPTGGNGLVNVDDLLAIIGEWGPCPNPNNCPADLAPPGGNDIVNVDDLLAVIGAWGACP